MSQFSIAASNYAGDEIYNQYAPAWRLVDYLLTGDSQYIYDQIKNHFNGDTDPDNALQKRFNNLGLPHYYRSESRQIIGKMFGYNKFNTTNITYNDIITEYYCTSLFKGIAESLIHYGGGAVVILPIDDDFKVHLVQGKNILGISFDSNEKLTYIKWVDEETTPINNFTSVKIIQVAYTYYKDGSQIYLRRESEGVETTIKFAKTYIDIPCRTVGLSHAKSARGIPYLYPLAVASMRLALNAANIDYLLEIVLMPRLIFKGSSPISSLSMKSWRGVQIGLHDSLEYLEYSNTALESGKDQLNRYMSEINGMTNQTTTSSSAPTKQTAAQINNDQVNQVVLQAYLINYLEQMMTDSLQLMSSFQIVDADNALVTFQNNQSDPESQNTNKEISNGN